MLSLYRRFRVKINNFKYRPFPIIYNTPLKRWAISYLHDSPPWWLLYTQFKDGVPITDYGKQGLHINPTFVAYFGFQCFERYERDGGDVWLDRFRVQADWFCKNVRWDSKRGSHWMTNFDWSTGSSLCKAPFVDCMTQSLAISLLTLAFQVFGDEKYLNIAKDGLQIYGVDYHCGGIRSQDEYGHIFFEEYPADPLPRIFDGFLLSILGPLDLWLATGDIKAKSLFDLGMKTIKAVLEDYIFLGFWFYYGGKNYHYLCDGFYQAYNSALLEILLIKSEDNFLLHKVRRIRARSKNIFFWLFAAFSSTIIGRYNQYIEKK